MRFVLLFTARLSVSVPHISSAPYLLKPPYIPVFSREAGHSVPVHGGVLAQCGGGQTHSIRSYVALSLRAFPVVTMETQPTEGKPPVRRDSVHRLCQNSDADLPIHTAVQHTLQGCKYQAAAAAGLTRWSRGSASSRWAVSGRWPWTCVRWLDAPSSGRLPASSWDACVHETRAPHSYSFLQQKHTEMHKQFDNIHFHYNYITQYCALIDSHIHSCIQSLIN